MTEMRQLPEARIYEAGLKYWPYKSSLQFVLDTLNARAPRGGSLLDIMCGPGWLLGEIQKLRPDLRLVGVDIGQRYVDFGNQAYPGISFTVGNVLDATGIRERFDTVICTGALHHVRYEDQPVAIANLASLVKQGGMAIISDVYIDDYTDETSRQCAAAWLGHRYLLATIENGAPPEVLEWTNDITINDVNMHEYKTSIERRLPLINTHFTAVHTTRTWPEQQTNAFATGMGDYVHLCIVR